ncbi:hypothetical protein DYB37_002973 [Aphanomyces astaci]|uniref:tRNA-dihydrouridine(16/17) synthase [NAD(P)(+)] n=1 Tax=Aphanomyces astaci TaxID=112090 RepID=A0A3R7BNB6_APHAT|nr:hypothetical protein DYB35_000083 [Aphanomyces astaci]RHZ18131.1 hypothetical protein DYB37_002973 [Aphanomyces astaci]
MVDQSEFAFRALCRRYGTQLCYTPMLHAKVFLTDPTYRTQRLDYDLLETNTTDHPVIAQFAGDDPQALLDAALLVQDRVLAVDLNLGCPQPIARKGHYGSFLLRDSDTILRILRDWKSHLSIPFTCKIRIIDEGSKDPLDRGLQATLRLVDQIEAAGASVITVHGRNRVMTGRKTGPADWVAIAAIQRRVSVPVIANGGVECFDDVAACATATGARGVMSAEALLENPTFFHGPQRLSPFRLVREYLELVRAFPSWNFHRVEKAHVARMLHAPLRQLARAGGTDADALIAGCSTLDELELAIHTVEHAWTLLNQTCRQIDSWYRRHQVVAAKNLIDREARKEVQQLWLAGGLRLTR